MSGILFDNVIIPGKESFASDVFRTHNYLFYKFETLQQLKKCTHVLKISARVSYNKLGQDDSLLEQENDRMVSNLSTKISTLKSIAIDLDNEAKYQNQFLGDVSNDFDSATGFLSSSLNRVNGMIKASSSNRKLLCYMILFLVGIFFIFYYVIGKFRR